MTIAKSKSVFVQFAKWISRHAGRPFAFFGALAFIVCWALTGPLFGYTDSWQLFVNTGTTILTFLMVFLIQNTQNRDAEAIQVKLDELIRASQGAHLALLDLEELEEAELDTIRAKYVSLARNAREELALGKSDTGTRDV